MTDSFLINSTRIIYQNETDSYSLNSTLSTILNNVTNQTLNSKNKTDELTLLFYGDSQSRQGLGINVGRINHFMFQWVFVNKFKHAAEWYPIATRSNWLSYSPNGIPNTVFDSNGYLINFDKKDIYNVTE